MASKKSRKLSNQPTLSTPTIPSSATSGTLLSTPAEIFTMILRLCPSSSLRNLRLVRKELYEPASQYLFERIWISPAKKDLDNFTAIAAHEYISTLVKEVAYDATNATRNSPLPLDWTEHLALVNTCMLIPDLKKATIERGYGQYRARRQEEWDLRMHSSKKHFTKKRLPKGFGAMLERPEDHQQVIPYLAGDLAVLVSGIRSLTSLKSLVVSDERYTSKSNRLTFRPTVSEWNRVNPDDRVDKTFWPEFTYRIIDPNVRGKDTLLMDPLPWFDNRAGNSTFFLPLHHRGLAVLMQAASMTGLNTIESLHIERDSEHSGISYHVLDMSPTELHHAKRALQGLKKIDLRFNSKSPNRLYNVGRVELPSFDAVLNKGLLPEALGTCTQLEELSIMLDKTSCCDPDVMTGEHTCGGFEGAAYQAATVRIPHLERLVGTHTWAALRSVTLGNMAVDEGELLAFLNRHARTLRRLRMVGMEVIDRVSDWTVAFSEERWAQMRVGGINVRLDSCIIE